MDDVVCADVLLTCFKSSIYSYDEITIQSES
jgi:hypothetical protein